MRPLRFLLFGLVPWLGTGQAAGAEPFRYPEARFGKGELRYVNGLPVLTVAGTPEEMGEQVGKLAALPDPTWRAAYAAIPEIAELLA